MITKLLSKLKPLIFVSETTNNIFLKLLRLLFRKNVLLIGTHDGIFHSDEVVACAILCLKLDYKIFWIVRSRDENVLKQCDICVDVGGGLYDHHKEKRYRPNGEICASAGLVWTYYGGELVRKIREKYFSGFSIDDGEVFSLFDKEVIQVVDYEDNGVPCDKQNPFGYIPTFHPRWDNTSPSAFNKQFKKVVKITMAVLEAEIKDYISKVYSKKVILDRWNDPKYFKDGILEIPSQTFKWQIPAIEINDSVKDEKRKINFVIFPHPTGDWAGQSVPPAKDNIFGTRFSFPKLWAGRDKKTLPQISRIKTATFCHLGCFFVRAKEKEDVIKMCKIASGIEN